MRRRNIFTRLWSIPRSRAGSENCFLKHPRDASQMNTNPHFYSSAWNSRRSTVQASGYCLGAAICILMYPTVSSVEFAPPRCNSINYAKKVQWTTEWCSNNNSTAYEGGPPFVTYVTGPDYTLTAEWSWLAGIVWLSVRISIHPSVTAAAVARIGEHVLLYKTQKTTI